MRTRESWEGESPFLTSPVQTQKKEDVIVPLKEVPSHGG